MTPRKIPREWPTHAYCPECDKINLVKIHDLISRSVCGDFTGGDIVCTCGCIIAAIYKKK